jgi:glycosyltransferase involved in cell wall biosynthesis
MKCPSLNDLPLPPPGKTGWPWTEESPALPAKMDDGSPWPKISIVTPSLNQGQFIEETIRSILLQGYPNLECIIIDGGSKDESVEIIRKYEKKIDYWVSEPDSGQGNAINKGFSHATGDIIAWLNSDDCYTKDALFHVASQFHKNKGCAAVVGGCRRVTPDGRSLNIVAPKKLSRDDIIDWGYGENLFYQPATFMASWAVKSAGKIREDFFIAIDYEYWLRLMKEGPFVSCPHILAEATIYPETKSQMHRPKIVSEQVQIMFEQGYPDQARLIVEQICNRLTSIENRVEKAKHLIPYQLIRPLLKKIGF